MQTTPIADGASARPRLHQLLAQQQDRVAVGDAEPTSHFWRMVTFAVLAAGILGFAAFGAFTAGVLVYAYLAAGR